MIMTSLVEIGQFKDSLDLLTRLSQTSFQSRQIEAMTSIAQPSEMPPISEISTGGIPKLDWTVNARDAAFRARGNAYVELVKNAIEASKVANGVLTIWIKYDADEGCITIINKGIIELKNVNQYLFRLYSSTKQKSRNFGTGFFSVIALPKTLVRCGNYLIEISKEADPDLHPVVRRTNMDFIDEVQVTIYLGEEGRNIFNINYCKEFLTNLSSNHLIINFELIKEGIKSNLVISTKPAFDLTQFEVGTFQKTLSVREPVIDPLTNQPKRDKDFNPILEEVVVQAKFFMTLSMENESSSYYHVLSTPDEAPVYCPLSIKFEGSGKGHVICILNDIWGLSEDREKLTYDTESKIRQYINKLLSADLWGTITKEKMIECGKIALDSISSKLGLVYSMPQKIDKDVIGEIFNFYQDLDWILNTCKYSVSLEPLYGLIVNSKKMSYEQYNTVRSTVSVKPDTFRRIFKKYFNVSIKNALNDLEIGLLEKNGKITSKKVLVSDLGKKGYQEGFEISRLGDRTYVPTSQQFIWHWVDPDFFTDEVSQVAYSYRYSSANDEQQKKQSKEDLEKQRQAKLLERKEKIYKKLTSESMVKMMTLSQESSDFNDRMSQIIARIRADDDFINLQLLKDSPMFYKKINLEFDPRESIGYSIIMREINAKFLIETMHKRVEMVLSALSTIHGSGKRDIRFVDLLFEQFAGLGLVDLDLTEEAVESLAKLKVPTFQKPIIKVLDVEDAEKTVIDTMLENRIQKKVAETGDLISKTIYSYEKDQFMDFVKNAHDKELFPSEIPIFDSKLAELAADYLKRQSKMNVSDLQAILDEIKQNRIDQPEKEEVLIVKGIIVTDVFQRILSVDEVSNILKDKLQTQDIPAPFGIIMLLDENDEDVGRRREDQQSIVKNLDYDIAHMKSIEIKAQIKVAYDVYSAAKDAALSQKAKDRFDKLNEELINRRGAKVLNFYEDFLFSTTRGKALVRFERFSAFVKKILEFLGKSDLMIPVITDHQLIIGDKPENLFAVGNLLAMYHKFNSRQYKSKLEYGFMIEWVCNQVARFEAVENLEIYIEKREEYIARSLTSTSLVKILEDQISAIEDKYKDTEFKISNIIGSD